MNIIKYDYYCILCYTLLCIFRKPTAYNRIASTKHVYLSVSFQHRKYIKACTKHKTQLVKENLLPSAGITLTLHEIKCGT